VLIVHASRPNTSRKVVTSTRVQAYTIGETPGISVASSMTSDSGVGKDVSV